MIDVLIKFDKLDGSTKSTLFVFRELCKAGIPLVIVYDKTYPNCLNMLCTRGRLQYKDHREQKRRIFRWNDESAMDADS